MDSTMSSEETFTPSNRTPRQSNRLVKTAKIPSSSILDIQLLLDKEYKEKEKICQDFERSSHLNINFINKQQEELLYWKNKVFKTQAYVI